MCVLVLSEFDYFLLFGLSPCDSMLLLCRAVVVIINVIVVGFATAADVVLCSARGLIPSLFS